MEAEAWQSEAGQADREVGVLQDEVASVRAEREQMAVVCEAALVPA